VAVRVIVVIDEMGRDDDTEEAEVVVVVRA
jgi:hypothetical protein